MRFFLIFRNKKKYMQIFTIIDVIFIELVRGDSYYTPRQRNDATGRPFSSVGQSERLIIARSLVQFQQGPPAVTSSSGKSINPLS